jgi:hypothetical protein
MGTCSKTISPALGAYNDNKGKRTKSDGCSANTEMPLNNFWANWVAADQPLSLGQDRTGAGGKILSRRFAFSETVA